jgi:hypoxanthine-DNA glycosylase
MSLTECISFEYSAASDSRILILGSMPGKESLKQQEYYVHPQNSFWFIMGKLFNVGRDLPYPERLKKLSDHGVALWDVAGQCIRDGSLDSSIIHDSVVPNDFEKLFKSCPNIKHVFFNGAKSEELYNKRVLKNLPEKFGYLQYQRLPSTSPAHASMTKEEKLGVWRAITKE